MTIFASYDGTGPLSTLTTALLSPSSGITIIGGSIVLNASALSPSAGPVNFYDGSLTPLGIGAGLLLTSGTTPDLSNTMPWFGTDNSGTSGFYNGDADIDAVVNTVFQTQSYDATKLSFDFTVTDPNATSVSFDLVFGSDEFPEWVDQFVDSAVVMVNGVNYALFNHDPMHPLSVVSSNLAAGYFQNNEPSPGLLPIEYDGVSHVLKIVAPIQALNADGTAHQNHIKIGIADTGDHIYDSGIFIANLSAGFIPGSGVVSPTTVCDDSSNSVTGSAKDEYFDLKGGDDIAYAGAGDDIVVAGAGNDIVYGGSGADQMKGDAGDDMLDGGSSVDAYGNVQNDTAVYAGPAAAYAIVYDAASGGFTVTDLSAPGPANEGVDKLKNVEVAKFADKSYALGLDGTVTLLAPPPPPAVNTPGLLFISGIGAEGQTLTANVSDADGVPAGGVTFAWQADGVDLGIGTSSLDVNAGLAGKSITATASYIDGASKFEFLTSDPKAIAAAGDGDFTIVLLTLDTPIGASEMNPLTTLIKNAIDLGVSPIEATQIVKDALSLAKLDIGADVDLLHYDAYKALVGNPGDAVALAVEQKAVQVAVMTSVGGDQIGMALTQAILLAHSTHTTLDLGNETVIRDVLGLVPTNPDDPNDPVNKIVHEIWDRNDNIGQASDLVKIETEWADMQSGLKVVLSGTIADLSIHLNQAPTGFAAAELPTGTQGIGYTIGVDTLLKGFSDPDPGVGTTLSIGNLWSDVGLVVPNPDGSFTIDYDGYTGPVELTYDVLDGQGGVTVANQFFVVLAAVDHEATGTLAISGTAAEGATIGAGFNGLDDVDGGIANVAYQWQLDAGPGFAAIDGATGADLAIPADQSYVGLQVRLTAVTTDAYGGTTEFISTVQTVANVEDEATGTLAISGTAAEGATISAVTTGLVDVDGGIVAVTCEWQLDAGTGFTAIAGATGAALAIPGDQSYVGLAVRLTAVTTDAYGGSTDFISAAQTVANVNDAPSGAVMINGTATQGQTLVATNTLSDADGLGAIHYQWQANGADIGGATADTYTLTLDQVGTTVSVVASYVDGQGTAEHVSSAETALVGAEVGGTRHADTLDGTAGNDSLSGLGGNDTLNGLAGDDKLDGGAGADTMLGGAGNDTYYVDNTKDRVVETASTGGIDTVYSDQNWTLGDFVENLTLAGTRGIDGNGNALGNAIRGNDGANVLNGGDGADRLAGGAGDDWLSGGAGADRFIFDAALSAKKNVDKIIDFVHDDDTLVLNPSIFTQFAGTQGSIDPANFVVGPAATDPDDYLIYDDQTGTLYYDADGSGSTSAAAPFATLIGVPTVEATDFWIGGG